MTQCRQAQLAARSHRGALPSPPARALMDTRHNELVDAACFSNSSRASEIVRSEGRPAGSAGQAATAAVGWWAAAGVDGGRRLAGGGRFPRLPSGARPHTEGRRRKPRPCSGVEPEPIVFAATARRAALLLMRRHGAAPVSLRNESHAR